MSEFLLIRVATVRRLLRVGRRVALPFRLVRLARGFYAVQEVAQWMVSNRLASTREEAEAILRREETT